MGTLGKRPKPGEPRPATPQAKPNGDTNRSLLDIEIALAEEFGWKRNVIVFNVNGISGKLPIFHECDMLVMTKAGYLTEIEIKRSFTDFCNEFKKSHHHESYGPDIKEFWYCVPQGILQKVKEKLSEKGWCPSGIITYDEKLNLRYNLVPDIPNSVRLFSDSPRPLSLEQQLELARLGAIRQITLRKKIQKLEKKANKPNERYLNRIVEQDIIIKEYRQRFKDETGYSLDEKEVIFR